MFLKEGMLMSLMKKFEVETPKSFPGISGKWIIASVSVLLLVSVIIEVWSSNRLSTYGEQISQIYQAKSDLELQNQILKDELAQESALSSVSGYASSLGFTSISHIQYLGSEGLALNR